MDHMVQLILYLHMGMFKNIKWRVFARFLVNLYFKNIEKLCRYEFRRVHWGGFSKKDCSQSQSDIIDYFCNPLKTELFISLTELIDIYSKWSGNNESTLEIIKEYQKDLEEEIWFMIYQNCLDIKLIQFLDLLFEAPANLERDALFWLAYGMKIRIGQPIKTQLKSDWMLAKEEMRKWYWWFCHLHFEISKKFLFG